MYQSWGTCRMISKFPPCILSVTLSDRALTLTASPHLMQIVAVFYVFHPPIRHALKRNTIEIAVFTLLVGTLFKNALHHPHPCLSSCSSLCSMVVEIGMIFYTRGHSVMYYKKSQHSDLKSFTCIAVKELVQKHTVSLENVCFGCKICVFNHTAVEIHNPSQGGCCCLWNQWHTHRSFIHCESGAVITIPHLHYSKHNHNNLFIEYDQKTQKANWLLLIVYEALDL